MQDSEKIREIDLMDFAVKVWQLRKKLMRAAILGAIIGIVIAFSFPKQYVVSVVLTPETSSKTVGGLTGMAASFLGPNLGNPNIDAVNPLLAREIVSSTPFLLELLDANVVNENKHIDAKLGSYLESEVKPWWKYILGIPQKLIKVIKSLFESSEGRDNGIQQLGGSILLSSQHVNQVSLLSQKVSAAVDNKTSMITITVHLQDPIITAVVADSVVTKLQKYLVNYKISKAQDDLKYWKVIYQENKTKYYESQKKYAQFVDSNNNVVLHSSMVERERLQNEMSLAYQVYVQVAQQLQAAQAKVQETKPAFTVIEPPVVPLYPTGLSKLVVIFTFAFILVLLDIVWLLFLKSFLLKLRERR